MAKASGTRTAGHFAVPSANSDASTTRKKHANGAAKNTPSNKTNGTKGGARLLQTKAARAPVLAAFRELAFLLLALQGFAHSLTMLCVRYMIFLLLSRDRCLKVTEDIVELGNQSTCHLDSLRTPSAPSSSLQMSL